MPYKMTHSGRTYYLSYDQVGTLRIVTNENGTIVKRIDYDTFGNVLADSNETLAVPFGFAGGLYDPDTKLTRFGYRDYDAQTGKWTAKDPIGFDGGDTNLYGYVLSNPVNLVDPEGLAVSIPWPRPIWPPIVNIWDGISMEGDPHADDPRYYDEETDEDDWHQHCSDMYFLCQIQSWGCIETSSCGDSLLYCTSNQVWPFERCSPSMPKRKPKCKK